MSTPLTSRVLDNLDAIQTIAHRNGARNVRVFGSVACGDADESSDLDLLVSMESGRTLFDIGAIVHELLELLWCRVDLVTEGALHGRLRANVLRDAVRLVELAA